MLQLKCKIFLLIKYKDLQSQRIQACCSIIILLIIFYIQFKKVIKIKYLICMFNRLCFKHYQLIEYLINSYSILYILHYNLVF